MSQAVQRRSIIPVKMVFCVEYRDERCKIDAINALNAIDGVSAQNDTNSGMLSRDVTVTVTSVADPQIPGRILNIFGSAHKKWEFDVTFNGNSIRIPHEALRLIKALPGVHEAKFLAVSILDEHAAMVGPNGPSTLRVTGDADPEIVLNLLQNCKFVKQVEKRRP